MRITQFKKYSKLLFLIPVLILLGVAFWLLFPTLKGDLEGRAKEELLASLKSPSTAEFIGEPEFAKGFMEDGEACGSIVDFDWKGWATPEEDAKRLFYTVSMTVDAQNSYGAMMRENYTCVFSPPVGSTPWCTETESYENYRDFCDEGGEDWWDTYLSE